MATAFKIQKIQLIWPFAVNPEQVFCFSLSDLLCQTSSVKLSLPSSCYQSNIEHWWPRVYKEKMVQGRKWEKIIWSCFSRKSIMWKYAYMLLWVVSMLGILAWEVTTNIIVRLKTSYLQGFKAFIISSTWGVTFYRPSFWWYNIFLRNC